jgi:hypothetical protein
MNYINDVHYTTSINLAQIKFMNEKVIISNKTKNKNKKYKKI